MKEVSERVSQGESFLITKNSEVIFEIKPKIKKSQENLPIISDKERVIAILQNQIEEKIKEISILNQHISDLLKSK